MRLTRFFRLKESIRQLQAREGISGLAFRLNEEPFRVDPAELIFGQTGIFSMSGSGAVTRVVLYDAEQRVDSDQMDPLMRSSVVSGGFDNLSLIEQLPRFHFLFCEHLQQHHASEWRQNRAWQISHRSNSRFIFSYTTQTGVLCDMDTQRLLPCPECIRAMNELGYMKKGITDSGHLLSLLDNHEFYTRKKSIRPNTCTTVPGCLWVDWAQLAEHSSRLLPVCANANNSHDCDTIGTHYSHSDINHRNFHYLTSLCHNCHTAKPGHENIRNMEKATAL